MGSDIDTKKEELPVAKVIRDNLVQSGHVVKTREPRDFLNREDGFRVAPRRTRRGRCRSIRLRTQRSRYPTTKPDSEVAFLVLDKNGNGLIDDGSELFGSATRRRDGTIARNGFAALLDLDGGPEASDGAITPSDPIYSRLRLWVDRNHNGRSEPSELLTLGSAGILAIFTGYEVGWEQDDVGNRYAYKGTALVNRNDRAVQRAVFDVILATR